MRHANFSIPFDRLTGLLTAISVRTRIIVLALIPVIGFLANGLTYISGEGDVGTAFETVKYSTALSGASRDFKSAIAAMRIIVKDFNADPSKNLVVSFQEAHARAVQKSQRYCGFDRPTACREHREPAQGCHGVAQHLHRSGAGTEDPRL